MFLGEKTVPARAFKGYVQSIHYYWRASEASETLTGVKMKKSGMFIYWRASVASETLTGVTQSKIGDVCLLASERSERDSIRGG